MHKFRLYISGRTPITHMAIQRLQAFLEDEYPSQHDLEVVDVVENPRRAVDERILATPTLVRVSPEPVRRLIGNMNDRQRMSTTLSS